MSSQAVGFQFQGDVIGGASLVYSATGRLLKALNNDGVDFYAVSASIQLGKLLPLSQEREAAICQLLEQRRTSRESYLSKALRIGWGHSSIPHELARTKAGVSALNIIGLFATGCKPFESAQALSSLMQMYGCEADAVPSLDSLSTMVEFLAPFVTKSTFDAVLANVKLGCLRVLRSNRLEAPNALEIRGDGAQWARIVKHLMTTSIALEEAHVAVGQRGAWLSAFAAHILGMSVTVYLENVVLWEAAGANGSVILYLVDQTTVSRSLTQSSSPNIQLELLDVSTSSGWEPSMLLLSELFESGIGQVRTGKIVNRENQVVQVFFHDFDDTMIDHIREAICHFSEDVFDNQTMSLNKMHAEEHVSYSGWPINGNWPLRKQPLQTVLQDLGVLSSSRRCLITNSKNGSSETLLPADTKTSAHIRSNTLESSTSISRAFRYLPYETASRISRVCKRSEEPKGEHRVCLCCRSVLFIFRMSALAIALAQCSYDTSSMRINESVLTGSFALHDWLRGRPMCDYDSLTGYLVRMLDCHENDLSYVLSSRNDLARSKGGFTIYNRALFDSECFDEYGRFLAITPGQISYQGLRRNFVTGDDRWYEDDVAFEGTFNTFRAYTEITPFFAKGPNAIDAVIEVESETIRFQFKLCEASGGWMPLNLTDCMKSMLVGCKIIGRKCQHKSQTPYIVRQAHSPVIVHTLGDVERTLDLNANPNLVFAVAGSPLSQMIQGSLLAYNGWSFALQGESCLDCIISEAKKDPKIKAILMS